MNERSPFPLGQVPFGRKDSQETQAKQKIHLANVSDISSINMTRNPFNNNSQADLESLANNISLTHQPKELKTLLKHQPISQDLRQPIIEVPNSEDSERTDQLNFRSPPTGLMQKFQARSPMNNPTSWQQTSFAEKVDPSQLSYLQGLQNSFTSSINGTLKVRAPLPKDVINRIPSSAPLISKLSLHEDQQSLNSEDQLPLEATDPSDSAMAVPESAQRLPVTEAEPGRASWSRIPGLNQIFSKDSKKLQPSQPKQNRIQSQSSEATRPPAPQQRAVMQPIQPEPSPSSGGESVARSHGGWIQSQTLQAPSTSRQLQVPSATMHLIPLTPKSPMTGWRLEKKQSEECASDNEEADLYKSSIRIHPGALFQMDKDASKSSVPPSARHSSKIVTIPQPLSHTRKTEEINKANLSQSSSSGQFSRDEGASLGLTLPSRKSKLAPPAFTQPGASSKARDVQKEDSEEKERFIQSPPAPKKVQFMEESSVLKAEQAAEEGRPSTGAKRDPPPHEQFDMIILMKLQDTLANKKKLDQINSAVSHHRGAASTASHRGAASAFSQRGISSSHRASTGRNASSSVSSDSSSGNEADLGDDPEGKQKPTVSSVIPERLSKFKSDQEALKQARKIETENQKKQFKYDLVIQRKGKQFHLPEGLKPLQHQTLLYKIGVESVEEEWKDEDIIRNIKRRFRRRQTPCVKYNYGLDETVQNFSNFHAYFQLSPDETEFIIYNKKPVENPEYILEADPYEVKKKKDNLIDERGKQEKYFNDPEKFTVHRSNASFKISDIQGIIYGGVSSRFWMYRKHMCQIEVNDFLNDQVQFRAWECITLILPYREVDLVIPSERDMTDIIRLLNYEMIMAEGKKSQFEKLDRYHRWHGRPNIERMRTSVERQMQVTKGLSFRYTLMKIRTKISYMAFLKRMTVQELFCTAILNSYNELVRLKEINIRKMDEVFNEEEVQLNIQNQSISNVLKLVMKINSMNFRENWSVADELELERAREFIFNNKKDLVYIKKKNGKMQVKEIDHGKNMQTIAQIQDIISKNKTMDIFPPVKFDDENTIVNEDLNYNKMIRYKRERNRLLYDINKLKIILNIRAIQRSLYIRILLHKISLVKRLFVLDLETGLEVFIPQELSMENYPLNYQFYDTLLNSVQENAKPSTKEFHAFKNQFRLNLYNQENVKQKVLERLGIVEPISLKSNDGRKMTFKHSIVNQKEEININHHLSHHTRALQKSKYMMIDDDLARLQTQFTIQTKALMEEIQRTETISGGGAMIDQQQLKSHKNNQKLVLRFCCPDEINKKRQKNLQIKATFLAKINYLKLLGKKQELMDKIDAWIESNIEEIAAKAGPPPQKQDTIPASSKERRKSLSDFTSSLQEQIRAQMKDMLRKRQIHEKLRKLSEQMIRKSVVNRRIHSIGRIRHHSRPDNIYRKKVRYIENNIEQEMKFFQKPRAMDLIQNEMKLFRQCQVANVKKAQRMLSAAQKKEIEELKKNLEANHLLIIQKKQEILTDEMRYKTLVGLNLGTINRQSSMSMERSLPSDFSIEVLKEEERNRHKPSIFGPDPTPAVKKNKGKFDFDKVGGEDSKLVECDSASDWSSEDGADVGEGVIAEKVDKSKQREGLLLFETSNIAVPKD